MTLPGFFLNLISFLYFGINTRWDSIFVYFNARVIYDFFSLLLVVVFVCRKGSLGQFTVLCEKYQPSIERDPTYKEVFYVYIIY